MPADNSDEPLERFHRELGFKRLNPLWAKAEILLGLAAVAAGLLGGMYAAASEARPGGGGGWAAWAGCGTLVVLGGYLALAGHRSHLHQSSNRLAAHLAELVRKHSPPESPP
jgi:hypothetical protein